MEAAADDVVHAAGRHRVERLRHHLERAAAQQELERRRGRKLRRASEASPLRIELPSQGLDGFVDKTGGQRLARRGRLRAQRLDE